MVLTAAEEIVDSKHMFGVLQKSSMDEVGIKNAVTRLPGMTVDMNGSFTSEQWLYSHHGIHIWRIEQNSTIKHPKFPSQGKWKPKKHSSMNRRDYVFPTILVSLIKVTVEQTAKLHWKNQRIPLTPNLANQTNAPYIQYINCRYIIWFSNIMKEIIVLHTHRCVSLYRGESFRFKCQSIAIALSLSLHSHCFSACECVRLRS